MMRRWVIRGLALTLLTLCVVAWVGSYWQCFILAYGDAARTSALDIDAGSVLIYSDKSGGHGWKLTTNWPGWLRNVYYPLSKHRLIGFAFDEEFGLIVLPFWFPTLLSALLLWFAWRKTRAMPVGGAFPVEPTKSGEKQS